MNILPLVFTFILIFSCLCLTFFKEVKSFFLIETALSGYWRTERVVDNALAKKNYRKIKVQPAQKSPTQPKRSDYVSRRSLSPPLENSKFNLEWITKEDTEIKTHPLYEPLAHFLRTLYKKNLFDKTPHPERMEYLMLEAIVKKLRKCPEAIYFAELSPDDPKLKALYYKMLKGTNRYSKERGIPPLAHFFSLEKKGKALNASFASPFLLEALFGEEISEEILNIEKKNWDESNKYYYISKEDLQNILFKNPRAASLLLPLEPYLDYSKQFKAREHLAGRDKKTGIGIEKKIK